MPANKLHKMTDNANIVDLLLAKPFDSLPYEEKLTINQQGRSTPKIDIVQKVGKGNGSFQLSWYKNELADWKCCLVRQCTVRAYRTS